MYVITHFRGLLILNYELILNYWQYFTINSSASSGLS